MRQWVARGSSSTSWHTAQPSSRCHGHRYSFSDMFRSIGWLLPLEVAVVAVLVLAALRRSRRRSGGGSLDVPERILESLVSAGLPDRAARLVATEAAIFYYA